MPASTCRRLACFASLKLEIASHAMPSSTNAPIAEKFSDFTAIEALLSSFSSFLIGLEAHVSRIHAHGFQCPIAALVDEACRR